MNEAQIIGIAVGLGVVGIMLLIIFIKSNIVLCQPNELVIVAGRRRKKGDGSLGYRVIRGGRGFKMPLVESVARLPLTSMAVDLHLTKVMCEGMIPVQLEGRASVKLAGREDDGMDEAIERFLGRGADAVVKSAKQAIEGAVRGVIAGMTPEAANTGRLELAGDAASRAREDLRRLGIVLDYLQIHEISDEHGYLEAIGRRQNAEVQRDARIAEATADAEARKVAAAQRKAGREAEISADLDIVEMENALEVKTADLATAANRARERSKVAGAIARTEAEVELQAQRVTLSERAHEADTVIPARARLEASRMDAEGSAARIREDGKATAEAVQQMRAEWADGEARDLFLIRMMPELLDKVTRVMAENLRIDKLTMVDGGQGEGLPNHIKNLAGSATSMIEQIETSTGIDLSQIGRSKSGTGIPRDLS
jgi:flotillin